MTSSKKNFFFPQNVNLRDVYYMLLEQFFVAFSFRHFHNRITLSVYHKNIYVFMYFIHQKSVQTRNLYGKHSHERQIKK